MLARDRSTRADGGRRFRPGILLSQILDSWCPIFTPGFVALPRPCPLLTVECIVYTWDYHSSLSVWNGLRTQPILTDEVQTFKALILVHKLLQEGHPVVSF